MDDVDCLLLDDTPCPLDSDLDTGGDDPPPDVSLLQKCISTAAFTNPQFTVLTADGQRVNPALRERLSKLLGSAPGCSDPFVRA